MIAALLPLLSVVQTVQLRDVPIEELNAPFVGFTCSRDGLPTVRMEHKGARGVIHFGQYGRSSPVSFDLLNAVQSVAHDPGPGHRRWIVKAEGVVQNAAGVAAGTKATVLLTIHAPEGAPVSGDFSVQAGKFSRSETGCMPMPLPTHMLGTLQ